MVGTAILIFTVLTESLTQMMRYNSKCNNSACLCERCNLRDSCQSKYKFESSNEN